MTKIMTNPYLPLDEYVPDGEPHLFGDRVYIYGSHDQAGGKSYCELDYVCWSAPKEDLTDWKYEGISYKRNQDLDNLSDDKPLFAPDVARGPDGRYYLYYALLGLPHISVAVSVSPKGPFEYYGKVTYDDGRLPEEGVAFDPAILVDGPMIYLYYGITPLEPYNGFPIDKVNDGAYVVQLATDMKTIVAPPICVVPGGKSSVGTPYEDHPFFEASSIRCINGWYYFVYSSAQGHELCYGISESPTGPFQFKGVIISNADVGLNGNDRLKNPQGNNHGGILVLDNQAYIFYHRHTHGTHYSRQACAEKIIIDGQTGLIEQVGVTSCGLSEHPLPTSEKYSAGIVCQSYNTNRHQFPYVFENQGSHYVKEITDGSVLAYKHFAIENDVLLYLQLRGDGGEVSLYTNDNLIDRIDSTQFNPSSDWQYVSLKIPSGDKVPIFLTFATKGEVELLSLEFSNC